MLRPGKQSQESLVYHRRPTSSREEQIKNAVRKQIRWCAAKAERLRTQRTEKMFATRIVGDSDTGEKQGKVLKRGVIVLVYKAGGKDRVLTATGISPSLPWLPKC